MEVTGISVAEAQRIANASIVDGDVDASGNLVLKNGAGAEFNAGKVVVPLAAWPVGSIYIGVTATNPNALFGGGTWERFGNGKVLVSQSSEPEFDTALETGGTKEVTLTEAQMPSHTHTQDPHDHGIAEPGNPSDGLKLGVGTYDMQPNAAGSGWPFQMAHGQTYVDISPATATNQPKGGSQPHTNLQPYIVVYMWRRTA